MSILISSINRSQVAYIPLTFPFITLSFLDLLNASNPSSEST